MMKRSGLQWSGNDLITRNKDIDDEDILELIEIKKLKLTAIERQIDDLLEKNSTRYEEIIKLKLLISKLELIPEKDCGTDFIQELYNLKENSEYF